MTTQYSTDPNIRGVNGFGTQFSDQTFTSTLAPGMDTTCAVPASAAMGMPSSNLYNKFIAVISYARATPASPVFVALNAAASAPAGAPFALSPSVIEPEAKHVKTGDVLHFFCVAAANVSVQFFAVQD